ncbi:alpha,alpha-trehalose phosphorylase [Sediminihabitans luteus]|uniref:Alpha,alpha-trehalose phosphorylase n=1 Tax=Sediminihabitans luteus TaxID=1138585 RepID=A0A2M9D149_9CELL|nr:glycosyl hydrolase family 65 protein [Sediminihabitans luteus]PJJ77899.1 alpha,alpha-trehalose phosphorylase [Sediminihabitans luteus]GII99744.1 kojibiose phosphorylase [Sediminihabitans luteus]
MPRTEDERRRVDRARFPVDPWRLVESRYSGEELGVTETLFAVGNGYLGMRGNVEEGRDSHTHGTFVNGFHETWKITHAEEAYGLAQVGQTIVNAPDAKVIRLYVDDEPLLLSVAELLDYERALDLRDGVLRRELLWRTPGGKRVRVRSERMVSFDERHLAVMTFEVTLLDEAAPVAISSQILNRQDGEDEYHVPSAAMGEGFDPRRANRFSERVLQPTLQWADDDRLVLGYRTTNSGMTLAVAADHVLETENRYERRTQVEDDLAKHVFRVSAEPGVPIRLTKTVAYHTSRGVPARELVDRCRRTLDRARDVGVEGIQARQREWLDAFWERSDVEIEGDDAAQQAVRWNLFQLAQATARAEGTGVPAKGLTGSGYGGHYFWDTEIYVLPFLTYTSPRFARNALRFRYTMLDAARRRAAEVSQEGALFPWRTINGEEASAYYAAGTAQYHIDADVSYALVQYVRATGDAEFLDHEGVDILVETARMWADLGFWRTNGDDAFHIHGVTGPDEYTTVVNDNLFTNVMARFNLRAAAIALETMSERDPAARAAADRRLGVTPDEILEWRRAADAMAIPYAEHLGIHPQDSHFLEREVWDVAATPADRRPLLLHYHPLVIYRYQVLKQADVVLALFLQGAEFTPEQKLADFEYYDPLTTGDSTLSGVVQSIVAAEVGYQDLALEYFDKSLYVDLANLHDNAADGVHVASAGGVWSALVHGFGGVRDHAGGRFTIDPRLPRSWDSLTYRITVGGSRLRATLRADALELVCETGDGATVHVRGTEVHVGAGETVTVPLDGQGPLRPGRPGMRALAGNRREDGTLIKAEVPHG